MLTILLLDGAQRLFGGNSNFWSGIIALLKGPHPGKGIRSLRVIFTCSYVCSPSAFAGQSCAMCDCPKLLACEWCHPTGLLLKAQLAFTGPPWLLEIGRDCIVSLDSQYAVERLQLLTSEYQELLGNFRILKCRDALINLNICGDVYSRTAGQVCPSLLHSSHLRWPQHRKFYNSLRVITVATLKQAMPEG